MGRSGLPEHYDGFSVLHAESRERFNETLEIFVKAWTEERFIHERKYCTTRIGDLKRFIGGYHERASSGSTSRPNSSTVPTGSAARLTVNMSCLAPAVSAART